MQGSRWPYQAYGSALVEPVCLSCSCTAALLLLQVAPKPSVKQPSLCAAYSHWPPKQRTQPAIWMLMSSSRQQQEQQQGTRACSRHPRQIQSHRCRRSSRASTARVAGCLQQMMRCAHVWDEDVERSSVRQSAWSCAVGAEWPASVGCVKTGCACLATA